MRNLKSSSTVVLIIYTILILFIVMKVLFLLMDSEKIPLESKSVYSLFNIPATERKQRDLEGIMKIIKKINF